MQLFWEGFLPLFYMKIVLFALSEKLKKEEKKKEKGLNLD